MKSREETEIKKSDKYAVLSPQNHFIEPRHIYTASCLTFLLKKKIECGLTEYNMI